MRVVSNEMKKRKKLAKLPIYMLKLTNNTTSDEKTNILDRFFTV